MKIQKKIISLIFIAVFSFFTSIENLNIASAKEKISLDGTFVLDDLIGSTIEGKEFELTDYGKNVLKKTNALYLAEFNYNSESKTDWDLYLYVYNPRQIEYDFTSQLNKVNISFGEYGKSSYYKFILQYLNSTQTDGYVDSIIKFKVLLSESQKEYYYARNSESERIYNVSEIELKLKDTNSVESYTVGKSFKFTGIRAEDTLTSLVDEYETLTLDVHSTQYRPSGHNDKGEYTQDSLHSVYFAVPNEVIEKNGEMYAVHATWLNAVLKPMLVVGDLSVFEYFYKLLGQDIGLNEDYLYSAIGGFESYLNGGEHLTIYGYWFGGDSGQRFGSTIGTTKVGYKIQKLQFLFYSGTGEDSADNFKLSSEEVKNLVYTRSKEVGGDLVLGKYSRALFDSVDESMTDKTIKATDDISLDKFITTRTWWQSLWGNSTVSEDFLNLKAIEKLNEESFNGLAYDISNSLYVSESDVLSLKRFYNSKKVNSSVYLLRYKVSDYISQEATLTQNDGLLWTYKILGTNAYFCQQSVDLDFDVLDLTFKYGDKETVVPIVMEPKDIFQQLTPPIKTTSDEEPPWLKTLKLIIGLICLVLILYALYPVIKILIQIVLDVFKGIVNFFKGLASGRRK